MKTSELMTVVSHPRWIAAATKLAELSAESQALRRKADELEAIIATAPTARSVSVEAMELLGDAVPGGQATAIKSGQAARTELIEVHRRRETVDQAAKYLQQSMFTGTGERCSLAAELSASVCIEAGPAYRSLMIGVLDAVRNLRDKRTVVEDFTITLENGMTTLRDPIRQVNMLGSTRQPGSEINTWLSDLDRFFAETAPTAEAA